MHKKIVNRKSKSTSVNCSTYTSSALNSNDNVSPIAKRFVDINYNIESLSKAAGSTFEAIKNRVLWKKRSVTLTEYDPVYKVIYLGNVLTPWAKGLEALEKPLATLWKNYCINGSKAEIFMRITLMKSGMVVVTREHGKTSYEFNRICYISTHVKYPRVFAFVYRHPSKKLKNEIRCHAVLCSKEEDAVNLHTQLKHRLAVALSEFKRNLRMKQNARVLLTKALECHQSICSEQNDIGICQAIKCCRKCHRIDHDERTIEETSLLRACNNASPSELSFSSSTCTRRYSDTSSVRRQHASRDSSDFSNETCTAADSVDSTHSHSHSGLLSLTSSSLCEDYNCTDKTNSLVSTRSSNSSSRSSPSSISSCSCSAGSASASMCQCSRSSKKRRSTSSLNSSSCSNCTGSSFNMYTGKAGNSLIPVRKKHLMRGQSIFKQPLERSKSAPRLTSIDEEDDDDVDLTDSTDSASQSSYSQDDEDVDDDHHTPTTRVARSHPEITFDDEEEEEEAREQEDDDDYTISMNQCSLVDSIQVNDRDKNTGPHNLKLNVRRTDDSLTLGNIYHSQETSSSTSLPTTPRPTAKCYQYILGTI